MSIVKQIITSVFLVCTLASCGGSTSRPESGYKNFIAAQQNYYESIGGSKDWFQGRGAGYAWITGDGTIEAGTLKNSVWYKINYTLTVNGKSGNYVTYAVLRDGASTPTELGSDGATSYSYAVSLVSNGSLAGKVGSVN